MPIHVNNMDFTEAPIWIQERIIEAIEEDLGDVFDEGNSKHMELAQAMMCDDWSGA
jgi:hypothetical protein